MSRISSIYISPAVGQVFPGTNRLVRQIIRLERVPPGFRHSRRNCNRRIKEKKTKPSARPLSNKYRPTKKLDRRGQRLPTPRATAAPRREQRGASPRRLSVGIAILVCTQLVAQVLKSVLSRHIPVSGAPAAAAARKRNYAPRRNADARSTRTRGPWPLRLALSVCVCVRVGQVRVHMRVWPMASRGPVNE